MARPFAYITSAWSADKRDAKEEAVLCCRKLYEAGYTPVCPVLSMNEYLHRETAEEHIIIIHPILSHPSVFRRGTATHVPLRGRRDIRARVRERSLTENETDTI